MRVSKNSLIFLSSLIFVLCFFVISVFLVPPYLGVGTTVGGDEPFHVNNIVQFNFHQPLEITMQWDERLLAELVKYEREKILLDVYAHQSFDSKVDTTRQPETTIKSVYNYGKLYYGVASLFFNPRNYTTSLYLLRLLNIVYLLGGLAFSYLAYKQIIGSSRAAIAFVLLTTYYALPSFLSIVNPDATVFLFSAILTYFLSKSKSALIPIILTAVSVPLGLLTKQNLILYSICLLGGWIIVNNLEKLRKKWRKSIIILFGFTAGALFILMSLIKLRLLPEFIISTINSTKISSFLNPRVYWDFAKYLTTTTMEFSLDRTLATPLYPLLALIFIISIIGIIKKLINERSNINRSLSMLAIATGFYISVYVIMSLVFYVNSGDLVINTRHLIPVMPTITLLVYSGLTSLTKSKFFNYFLLSLLIFLQIVLSFRFILMYLLPRYYL